MARKKPVVTLEEMPDVMTPEQVGQLLPMIGRNRIYEMLGNGTIPAKRLGKQFIISKLAFIKFLEDM